jgi:hypothetical protein
MSRSASRQVLLAERSALIVIVAIFLTPIAWMITTD